MTSIGSNINYIRKLNKMNQIEFAKAINISQGSLSDIEKDKGYPALETVISIGRVFDVDLNWLVKGNKVLGKQVFKLPSVALNTDELDLLTNYRRLSEIDKLEINEIIKIKISIKKNGV